MTTSSFALTGVLTDTQVARLVIHVRRTAELTTEGLAKRLRRPTALVEAWEGAEVRPTDADIEALAGLCHISAEALVLRVEAFGIDRAMGVLRVGNATTFIDPQDGNEDVLRAYLGLVREARLLADDEPVELRSHDLDVLADYLDLDDTQLVEQLASTARVSHREAMEWRRQLLRRPVLASVALVAGGLASLGIAERSTAVASAPSERIAVVAAAPATTTTAVVTPTTTVAASATVAEPTTVDDSTPEAPPVTAAHPKASPHTPTTTAAKNKTEIADALAITNPDAPAAFNQP